MLKPLTAFKKAKLRTAYNDAQWFIILNYHLKSFYK